MQIWYNIIDALALPFMEYTFMKNALLCVILITPILGLLGTMVVSRGMSFFSDSLGHSAFTGIALGTLLGLRQPVWAMVLFGILFAVALILVKGKNTASTDTTIGVFSASAISLGLLLISRGQGVAKYSGFLVGDILSVSPTDLLLLFLAAVLVLIYWCVDYNKLSLLSVNESLSVSRGVRKNRIEITFAVAVAVIVMLSIPWVGVLLINALLVLPAAAARNVAHTCRSYTVLSVIIALLCGIGGLLLSYPLDAAPGTVITLLAAVVYFITFMPGASEKRGA